MKPKNSRQIRGEIFADIITSKKLAEIVGKSPATIRKYAPGIPGSEKHGNIWIFTDLPGAIKWFESRTEPGRPILPRPN